ncbi:MAG: transglycosylase domain-containing protein [Nitrospirales bacterium]|nr:transglycosylase domain-containing protein [Nitrospirales bacterium]
MFGIEVAAQRYLHKPASQLTMEEGAHLAAVIPILLSYHPTGTTMYVEKNKDLVLRRMSTHGSRAFFPLFQRGRRGIREFSYSFLTFTKTIQNSLAL